MDKEQFQMTASKDLRTVNVIYKGVLYRLNYDQYMGEYMGVNETEHTRFAVGRYEYLNAPDNWCPLPNEEEFKNGFITDRLHDMARAFVERNGISSPRFAYIYNAESGKPFRIGDHYSESVPSAWSVYYRGAFFYVQTDEEGALICKKQFDTEEELLSWLEAAPCLKRREE